jgi:hypothetical protein
VKLTPEQEMLKKAALAITESNGKTVAQLGSEYDRYQALAYPAAILAILAQLEAQDGWQPIETAPLDKSVLLWWVPIDGNKLAECAVVGQISSHETGQWWNGQTAQYQSISHVTRWMLLPSAPVFAPGEPGQ